MLRLLAILLLFSGTAALVCPVVPPWATYAAYDFQDGGDGSCYSQLRFYPISWSDIYSDCASYNSYLPILTNAFDNSALQQKAMNGTPYGEKIAGMWLGLTCTGNEASSCTWSDRTPVTKASYSNFDTGFPNATLGPCVYQDVTTAKWKSESCFISTDIGYYCKFTPTNNAPACSLQLLPSISYFMPYYFDGHCYTIEIAGDVDTGENICKKTCAHVASIHSEGENTFIRDLLITYNNPYNNNINTSWITSTFLGRNGSGNQWFDGSTIDYTNYLTPSVTSNPCSYMALNGSQVPADYWYTDSCTQPLTEYVPCKKPLVNECDSPYVPFPTTAPVICNGPQYLQGYGSLNSPGYPYYPYGQEANHCEYIQNAEEELHPVMTITYFSDTVNNFLANTSISKFEFYSSEDPNDQPFYTFDGGDWYNTVISPTNIMRAVYTTIGDSNHTYDWQELRYTLNKKLSCSFVVDYSYLGYYNQSASNYYYNENQMIGQMLSDITSQYQQSDSGNPKCLLDIYWNYAAYGNVNSSDSVLAPANYTKYNYEKPLIKSTGNNNVDLCSFIDQLNSYTIPPGTEHSCLVFYSGRSAQDFAACAPLNTQKFEYTFGVAINAATGVSTFTSNISNATTFFSMDEHALTNMIVDAVRPSVCQ